MRQFNFDYGIRMKCYRFDKLNMNCILKYCMVLNFVEFYVLTLQLNFHKIISHFSPLK